MLVTYSFLSLPLVSLDFELQFVYQILESVHILLVLLSLHRLNKRFIKQNQSVGEYVYRDYLAL